MKLLITGGAGFVGADFCSYMVSLYPNYKFICFDALTYAGNIGAVDKISAKSNFRFINGDITNKKVVFDLFEREEFDIVINFAAQTSINNSIDNPDIFMQTNVFGTQVLLDASVKYKVKKFHQVSTSAVYKSFTNKSRASSKENSTLNPESPYAASKGAADLLALAYCTTYGLYVTISRSCHIYGPYQTVDNIIPNVIHSALKDIPITLHTEKNINDWLYISDHSKAIDLILRKGKKGEIYNIGADLKMTDLEIVTTILKQLDKPLDLIHFSNKKNHGNSHLVNSEKIRKNLKWIPEHDFAESLKNTINWNLTHQEWIEKNLRKNNGKNY